MFIHIRNLLKEITRSRTDIILGWAELLDERNAKNFSNYSIHFNVSVILFYGLCNNGNY